MDPHQQQQQQVYAVPQQQQQVYAVPQQQQQDYPLVVPQQVDDAPPPEYSESVQQKPEESALDVSGLSLSTSSLKIHLQQRPNNGLKRKGEHSCTYNITGDVAAQQDVVNVINSDISISSGNFFTIEGSDLPTMFTTNGIETLHVEGHGEVIPVPATSVKEFYAFTDNQKAEYLRLLEYNMPQLEAIMNARSLKNYTPYEKVSAIVAKVRKNTPAMSGHWIDKRDQLKKLMGHGSRKGQIMVIQTEISTTMNKYYEHLRSYTGGQDPFKPIGDFQNGVFDMIREMSTSYNMRSVMEKFEGMICHLSTILNVPQPGKDEKQDMIRLVKMHSEFNIGCMKNLEKLCLHMIEWKSKRDEFIELIREIDNAWEAYGKPSPPPNVNKY